MEFRDFAEQACGFRVWLQAGLSQSGDQARREPPGRSVSTRFSVSSAARGSALAFRASQVTISSSRTLRSTVDPDHCSRAQAE
jgi:hypothetical protein